MLSDTYNNHPNLSVAKKRPACRDEDEGEQQPELSPLLAHLQTHTIKVKDRK